MWFHNNRHEDNNRPTHCATTQAGGPDEPFFEIKERARGTAQEVHLRAFLLLQTFNDESQCAAFCDEVLKENARFELLGDSWAMPLQWGRLALIHAPLKESIKLRAKTIDEANYALCGAAMHYFGSVESPLPGSEVKRYLHISRRLYGPERLDTAGKTLPSTRTNYLLVPVARLLKAHGPRLREALTAAREQPPPAAAAEPTSPPEARSPTPTTPPPPKQTRKAKSDEERAEERAAELAKERIAEVIKETEKLVRAAEAARDDALNQRDATTRTLGKQRDDALAAAQKNYTLVEAVRAECAGAVKKRLDEAATRRAVESRAAKAEDALRREEARAWSAAEKRLEEEVERRVGQRAVERSAREARLQEQLNTARASTASQLEAAERRHGEQLRAAVETEVGLAAEQIKQLTSQLTGAQTSAGMWKARAEAAEAKPRNAGTVRTLHVHVESRDALLTELQTEFERLKQQLADAPRPTVGRQAGALADEEGAAAAAVAAARPPAFVALRTSSNADAPMTPRTMEILRALCDEANLSFEGAVTAINLVYTLYFGVPPPDHLTFCSKSVKRSYDVLGEWDNQQAGE